jgi:hypothetical protein
MSSTNEPVKTIGCLVWLIILSPFLVLLLL